MKELFDEYWKYRVDRVVEKFKDTYPYNPGEIKDIEVQSYGRWFSLQMREKDIQAH